MKVLVTGAAGFVGSHVVDALLAEGCEVVSVDALIPQAHDAEPPRRDDCEFHQVDLRDEARLEPLLRGIDAVSHQAAMVGLGRSFDDITDYVRHNDAATAGLLRTLNRVAFRGRFVLAGSMVVYGEGAYICLQHGRASPPPRAPADLRMGRFDPLCVDCGSPLIPVPLTEESVPDPRNIYAATKLHQEHLCASFGRETDASVAVLRYHNVYGPRMPRETPYAGVASLFRNALEVGRSPEVFEDGRQVRDFVHVDDVAQANLLALTRERVDGVFNISSGEPHSIYELAVEMSSAFGPEAPEPVVTGDFRLGDVRHVFAPPVKARALLDFEPKTSFRDGMASFATAPLRGSLAG